MDAKDVSVRRDLTCEGKKDWNGRVRMCEDEGKGVRASF